ncbi:MAG: type II toxin-antitoxin system RelE/ParE family toxin [Gammaproteobacteria bacterium]
MDWLKSKHLDQRQARKLLYFLDRVIPEHGPRKHNDQQYKHLEGDVYEIKAGPKRGAEVRILCFEGKRAVICTEGITKRDKTPSSSIERSQTLCDTYKQAIVSGSIEIVTLED